jgi:hypothetical protein
MASDRDGLSSCCLAQLSIFDFSVGDSRIAETGSRPVAGRPRLLGTTFFLDVLRIFRYYIKSDSEPMGSGNFPPALTQATEVPMAQAEHLRTLVRALIPDARARTSTNLSYRQVERQGPRAPVDACSVAGGGDST